jgi:glucose-1-phosphate thymidylyltransferase
MFTIEEKSMKGVILAGGSGTRLAPVTKVLNKHLIPIYDKPMIYYPLSTLLLSGISDILIITTEDAINHFKKLLEHFNDTKINLFFRVQKEPNGLPDAFNYVPNEWRNDNLAIILGDNLFYGMGMGVSLKTNFNGSGCQIFAHKVKNPQDYGVVYFGKNFAPIDIEEKPKNKISEYAIPGFYFFDKSVIERVRDLKPSKRGELEITDLIRSYLKDNLLKVKMLERGTVWLDTGTPEGILKASEFVQVIEDRQGFKIGSPEEAAYNSDLIGSTELSVILDSMPEGDYRRYLKGLSEKS